ncbi:golgin candidate 5 [Daucus carota subsp. sativus]|uniref:golgin candidate 5 n=1 Tax=Daucus carota subsp. sativus TaxID=79200 RepID=UPI0007F02C77|nr:PREDICTED: golgin candidate 5 [Daucus carota subsp. sativus]
MSWFSAKVSLGNFPDFSDAVSKLSESVKNIEKNFDNALGFEERGGEASGSLPSSVDVNDSSDTDVDVAGSKSEESKNEPSQHADSLRPEAPSDEKEEIEPESSAVLASEQISTNEEVDEERIESAIQPDQGEATDVASIEGTEIVSEADVDSQSMSVGMSEANVEHLKESDALNRLQKESSETVTSENSESREGKPSVNVDGAESAISGPDETNNTSIIHQAEIAEEHKTQDVENVYSVNKFEEKAIDTQTVSGPEPQVSDSTTSDESKSAENISNSPLPHGQLSEDASDMVPEMVSHEQDSSARTFEVSQHGSDHEINKGQNFGSDSLDAQASRAELEKIKKDMKMMETALQGAARQAQAKADEIAKMMNENEQLKAALEDARRKSNEAEVESLREEYHQRVSALERKVYALTKERDTLRREQNKKSDAAALLKEKDEIITQVMAEGEELSKKQATQESLIRKLRAQIRELEEEKKGLNTKLQVEENKVESIKRDKAATEKLLQETIEKHQVELGSQKEYYTNALTAAKEAEALAEARANNEARTEVESRLREAEERETMLVQALEELRQTLSRKEQQEVFREEMLRKEIEDLQKRYQASERRCEELVTQVPDSTRPLLRQIEAMQETTSRRAEAWAAVERSLNSRLQEAEGRAAEAEERERSVNERLSQTLSRINVLEAQISCLRTEQTQLSKSLEKERQRAAEHRQEYLALKEEADTHEGHVNQLEEEIKELKKKHKQELHESLTQRELLQQEIEQEKAARSEVERMARLSSAASDHSPKKQRSTFENGNLTRRLSSASSVSSMEESYFLQASLDSSDNLSERRTLGEPMNPYYVKSMTTNAFEAALRQKEGELASYMSRLASMESIRDSLAEELVKMTEQCEKLKGEASQLPGVRAELEALRRRHSAALELMGERDEELEELRADIVDLKEMYREQVNLLVNKIQVIGTAG